MIKNPWTKLTIEIGRNFKIEMIKEKQETIPPSSPPSSKTEVVELLSPYVGKISWVPEKGEKLDFSKLFEINVLKIKCAVTIEKLPLTKELRKKFESAKEIRVVKVLKGVGDPVEYGTPVLQVEIIP
ncbi:MAG: hypothetical protein ACK413_00440 [Patescibacteria group bacterium]